MQYLFFSSVIFLVKADLKGSFLDDKQTNRHQFIPDLWILAEQRRNKVDLFQNTKHERESEEEEQL